MCCNVCLSMHCSAPLLLLLFLLALKLVYALCVSVVWFGHILSVGYADAPLHAPANSLVWCYP